VQTKTCLSGYGFVAATLLGTGFTQTIGTVSTGTVGTVIALKSGAEELYSKNASCENLMPLNRVKGADINRSLRLFIIA
jgi:hypothetical protein